MLQHNYSLRDLNTFGLDCIATKYSIVDSIESLSSFIKNNYNPKEELLILGGGSNILFTKNFNGQVVHNQIKGITVLSEDEESVTVKVGAGEVWHDFVLHAINKNWGGIENLSLIPGTVGASPIQNIGAYGVEVKDVITSVEAIEIKSNSVTNFSVEDCKFGYRESVFKKEKKGVYIITHVTYKLTKKHSVQCNYGAITETLKEMRIGSPTIKNISDAVIKIRESKLPNPKEIGNAGSFFKNPEIPTTQFETLKKQFPTIVGYKISDTITKVPAGWLIDNANWKGKTFGAIGVHKNQALVLVNYGGGNGNDIKKLSANIQQDIIEKYGIHLQTEVNII